MKKITLTLLLLLSFSAFSQTTLFNYDEIGTEFQFCFDTPDPDECTSTIEANDDTTGENPSAKYWQSIAPSKGKIYNYGLGAHFSIPNAPSLKNNGNFLTIAFRSNKNPSGQLKITAQFWANDNDKIDAYSTYTKTDGSWQTVEFNFSKSKNQGKFNNTTSISRVCFFIDQGKANGYTYGIDEAVMSTSSIR